MTCQHALRPVAAAPALPFFQDSYLQGQSSRSEIGLICLSDNLPLLSSVTSLNSYPAELRKGYTYLEAEGTTGLTGLRLIF